MLEILEFAKRITMHTLKQGGIAIDATVGNGYDTAFLAEAVGAEGQVFGFDVQEEAIRRTRERLAEIGLSEQVTLLHEGHETMATSLPEGVKGYVDAVMFNLGYLPGASDKTCITRPDTTRQALEEALTVLRPGGAISVVVYPGHEGGDAEAEAVEAWAASLDQQHFSAVTYRYLNRAHTPPYVVAVEKS